MTHDDLSKIFRELKNYCVIQAGLLSVVAFSGREQGALSPRQYKKKRWQSTLKLKFFVFKVDHIYDQSERYCGGSLLQ
jgi:hypothetical protein